MRLEHHLVGGDVRYISPHNKFLKPEVAKRTRVLQMRVHYLLRINFEMNYRGRFHRAC